MQNQGYIKLYRKMLDNPIVCKDSDYLAVWVYLLLNATHLEYDAIFKNERIKLKSGQLITGRNKISEKLKIDESKVQRILKKFENEHQIEQQTTSQNRLITIVSWEDYQKNEQQNEQRVNNKRTTSEQRVNTNNNVNNVKNEKNKKEIYKENFGEFGNVKLTTEEYDKIKKMFPNDYDRRIQSLDDYIQSKGKKYKDFVATLRNWARKDGYIFPEEKKKKKELLVTSELLSEEEWQRYYDKEMTEDEFKKIVEERQWMIEN